MLNLVQVKKDPQILEFIEQAQKGLAALGYTDHGLGHLNLVADRARTVAREIGLSEREQDLSAIAGFCHDMGNFLSRTYHYKFGLVINSFELL